MVSQVQIGSFTVGGGNPPAIFAGLCIIENEVHTLKTAEAIREANRLSGFPLVFKASFDKANRSSVRAYRGPGMEEGLRILAKVRAETGLSVMTDIHEPAQAAAAAQAVDVLQIPAFLCRQTDLLTAAAQTGKPVNLKKGQFLAPWDMKNAVEKVYESGNDRVLLTERGSSFGYNNLVADLRSLSFMAETGCPVIMDVTHSLQLPGGRGDSTAGLARFIPNLARAALAWGCDGLFLEVHEEPERALSDGANSLRLDRLASLLEQLRAVWEALRE